MRLNLTTILISVLLIFCLPNLIYAQKGKPYKWGDIPLSDLQMTVYEKDTSAAAVVLVHYGYMQIEPIVPWWMRRTEFYKRIKILKPAGLDYGDIVIYYPKSVDIDEVRAQVTSPDGTVSKLPIKDMIKEKTTDNYNALKLVFPNLQVGSVIEYKYETLSKNIRYLPTWYFHDRIPIRHSELRTKFPNDFYYTFIFDVSGDLTQIKDGKTRVYKGDIGTMTFMNDERFIMNEAVAITKEPYITNLNDYRAKVNFQLDDSRTSYDKDGEDATWEEVAERLYKADYFGRQYVRKEYFEDILEVVSPQLEKLSTDTEKAQFIYNFVRDNVEWDGSYAYGINKQLDDIFEKKRGDSGDINMIQLALLRSQSIEAFPLLVSTRSHGKVFENFPLADQFSHMLVYAKLDGEEVFIDVPSKNRSMFEPMTESLNTRGAIMLPTSVQWINIPPPRSNETFAYDIKLNEVGTISGTVKCSSKGYAAVPERVRYRDDKTGKHWMERFTKNYPEAEIKAGNFENMEDPNKALKEQIEINIPEAAQVAGNFIYFSPILYSNFSENPFEGANRYYPVDFTYPFSERFFINITIPEGYAVEEFPQSASFALENKGGTFRYVTEQKGDRQLQVVIDLKINQLQFRANEYQFIRGFFLAVEEKFGEQIVLKKK